MFWEAAARLQRLTWVLSVAALLPMGSVAVADDPAVAQPAIVLSVASLDRLLADVDTLLRAGGAAQYAEFVHGFVGGLNDLQGLDRGRPLGVVVFVDSRPGTDPAPLICLPVTDMEALRSTVASTGNALEPTADPREYTLRLGKDALRLSLVGDYALVSNPLHAPPPYSATEVVERVSTLPPTVDAWCSIRRAGFPVAVITQALADLQRDMARGMERREHEADDEYRLRIDVEQSLADVFGLVLTETDEVSATLTLGDDLDLHADVDWRAQAESSLAALLGSTLSAPQRVQTSLEPPAALRLHSRVALTGRGREIARQFVAMLRRQALAELEPAVPVDVFEQLLRAFDALDATAAAGRVETLMAFLPAASGRFVLFAGAAVTQPEAFDGAIRGLVPFALASGDLQRADLDAVKVGDLSFHRLLGRELRDRDKKLYGPDAALYLGAGRDAVWFVLGGGEAPGVLESALGGGEESRERLDSAAELVLRVAPWAALAAREGGERERRFGELVAATLQPDSALRAELRGLKTGARLDLRLDPASVRWLAQVAVLRAQAR